MPATQRYEDPGLLEVALEGFDLDTVQFTDEHFSAELVVRNLSDRRLEGTLELVNESERTLGADGVSLVDSSMPIELDPGEVHREPVGGAGLVAGTGSAVLVGIHRPAVAEETETTVTLEPGSTFAPLASLVFWDRDYYRVNHLWPRRAQYVSVAIALLSAVLAGMVVWLSFG